MSGRLFRKDTVVGVGGCSGDSVGYGVAAFSAEARDAIDAAHIIPRESDDEGHRTFVRSHTLRGSFVYTREEAAKRIMHAFPELSEAGLRRAVGHLENRVMRYAQPTRDPSRKSWVHGWRS